MTTDLSVYELVSKFPTTALDGSITACNIRLRTSDGWEFPIVLPSEFYDKSHAEIITECNDIIYQRLFPNRAEDEKFKELTDQIELSKAQQAKTELMLKAMSETLNEIIATTLLTEAPTDGTTTTV
ncbi:TPA: DUF1366 domain-containing protein [Streptococcus agalactiae]|uniref:DUF1366 domain-containing protein n=1 Tax=Streptococcus agalactiae TaxID=1311 RepID=UPI000D6F125C|nr:DUF1366 domain-containing protein [Streptococcus agalactiae]PWT25416.1 hypothetical protein CUZ34_01430 [Streptococcus agalactiae]HEN3143848.1 DUF1366 domain-containing protein [Streptococcus agalactiae]